MNTATFTTTPAGTVNLGSVAIASQKLGVMTPAVQAAQAKPAAGGAATAAAALPAAIWATMLRVDSVRLLDPREQRRLPTDAPS